MYNLLLHSQPILGLVTIYLDAFLLQRNVIKRYVTLFQHPDSNIGDEKLLKIINPMNLKCNLIL